jgi:uncharacterized membrane protein YgdD (TMEM256/DUF423 family)
MIKFVLLCAAIFALLSVVLGAFGAHALKTRISADMLGVFQTGVQYQFYHALALLVVGMMMKQMPSSLLMWAAGMMITGVVFFSGSLYGLAITGQKWLGPITPLGGVCLIIGWLLVIVSLFKSEL